MEKERMRVSILPNQFLGSDGVFDKEGAIKLSAKIAGVCYDKLGFNNLVNEPLEKTKRRADLTLSMGHYSVYDHIFISFNLENIPKMLAMVLNNEKQYTTSEKSARYTKIVKNEGSNITSLEEELYNKWLDIFKFKIKDTYGDVLNDSKIVKLAQENARYLVTVFMPTEMIYTTSLRQVNNLAAFMKEYMANIDTNSSFDRKLAESMGELITCFDKLNVLDERLMKNEKNRCLSIFGHDLANKQEYFGDIYSTIYMGSFASYAQAQRHRTLSYQFEMLDDKKYFVPPILDDDEKLVNEWNCDIRSVHDVIPQGEMLLISEVGKYDDFILKSKERLCTSAQLEIMLQTRDTLLKYKEALENTNNPLAEDILKYSHGARCTFPDFKCPNDCNFKEGKTLVRKI